MRGGASVAALLCAAAPGAAGSDCTDGVDCVCDVLSSDPNVIFCEDFEDPKLAEYTAGTTNASGGDPGSSGWYDKYGSQVLGCFDPTHGTHNALGPEEYKCIDIVRDGHCDNVDTDCAVQGHALGHKYRPGKDGGIVGEASFEPTRTFGITYAFRFSSGLKQDGHPMKTNEWGQGRNCLLGCNTGRVDKYAKAFEPSTIADNPPVPTITRWPPRAMTIQINDDDNLKGERFGKLLVGTQAQSNNYIMSPTIETWNETLAPFGSWVCHQIHIEGWGTNNATIRDWRNGILQVHVVGADLSLMRNNSAPDHHGPQHAMDRFAWNNYRNKGAIGDTIEFRYEDNLVVTKGAEPISCEAIGL